MYVQVLQLRSIFPVYEIHSITFFWVYYNFAALFSGIQI